ncbi:hypothetical protein BDW67DRAFT_171983 [Aspergillus spinulosporus]
MKPQDVGKRLRGLCPDKENLESVIKKVKVVVNGVGPFQVFKIHCRDLWRLILGIPPTAPAYLIAWLITKKTRENVSWGLSEVVSTGSLSMSSLKPNSVLWLCSDVGSPTTVLDSLATWGPLTTSFAGPGNDSIVHRSAAQHPKLYDDVFHDKEYLPATAMWKQFSYIKLVASKADDLQDHEMLSRTESAEYWASFGSGNWQETEKGTVQTSFLWEGALYELTALLTCAGAKNLLESESKESRGNFLGMEYVEG